VSEPRLALTFDDGPGPYTSELASVLDRNGARGTFFVVGSKVRRREDVVRQLARGGHELANHSYNHRRTVCRNARAAYRQMVKTNKIVSSIAGVRPRLFRPPWGLASAEVIAAAQRAGLTPVGWDVDPRDWEATDPGVVERRVLGDVREGRIVLFHDGEKGEVTLAALPAVLRGLEARGYRLVTVSELLGLEG
jgi:peptidoglycan/xylan/chitin deacetylase (PgdA/CDA1 family)